MYKRMKHFTAVLIALILTLGSVPVYAENDLSIKVDGVIYFLNSTAVNTDGVLMTGMFDTFKLLGAQLSWNQAQGTGTAAKGDKTLTFTKGKTEAAVNGESIQLPVAPTSSGDSIMVPLQAMAEALGARVSWDERTNVVTVSTGAGDLTLLDKTKVVDSTTTVLTYDAAVQRAIKTNSNAKSLEYTLENLREDQDSTKTNILRGWDGANAAAMAMSTPLGSYDSYKNALLGVVNLMRAEHAVKAQISNYKFNEQIIKDSSTYMVRSYLTDIAGYEMDMQLLKESIALAEKNISNLELQQSLGMVSDNDVRTAKQNYQQSLVNLENLTIMLANKRQDLNRLLDYALTAELVVNWEPAITPLTPNLTGYIQDRLRDDPTIKIKEKTVEEAKYTITTSWGILEESKVKNDNNLAVAVQSLEDAKKNLETTILSTYNTIQLLGENQKSLELDLEKARDNYNSVVASYHAGQTTIYDVDRVKLSILQAEIALEKNMYQQSNLIFAFERPYLLTAGS